MKAKQIFAFLFFLIFNSLYSQLYVTSSHTNVMCGGTNMGSITLQVYGGTAPYYYSLDSTNFTGPINQTNYSFTGLMAGTYNLQVKDSNGLIYSLVETIASNPTLVATPNVINNDSIVVNIVGGMPPYSCAISPYLNQFFNVYSDTITFTNLQPDTYRIIVQDAFGCSLLLTVAVPALSIQEKVFEELKIFPSPTSDFLKIDNQSLIEKIEIVNCLGSQVFSERYNSKSISLDLSSFESGVYFLHLTSDGKDKTLKFVKN